MSALSNHKTIRKKAIAFVKKWGNEEKERSESQSFWNAFFDVFGLDRKDVAVFEKSVKGEKDDNTKFIDLFWEGKLLVEHKTKGQSLDKAGSQAFSYYLKLKPKERPQYILLSDFANIRLIDLERNEEVFFVIDDLPDKINYFDFMSGLESHGEANQEYELNIKAAERLGELHDALSDSGYSGHDLEVFLVRILFCLFAEDTGIFSHHQFYNYILHFTDEDGTDIGMYLDRLFQVLDKKEGSRNKNIIDELNDFPYVNGHLFKERLDTTSFSSEMRDALINAMNFDWSSISPAIFGSLFQSVMSKESRREFGAHYTSEENILRLIKPLFLDALWKEFEDIRKLSRDKKKKLSALLRKITNLEFFDPACGCGNFLIITYRELRRLELAALREQYGVSNNASLPIGIEPTIKLDNFHGIELEEFPVRIAEVAMWLTQHQMNREFAKEFGVEPDLLPLLSAAHVIHGNALRIDWAEVVSPNKLNYIIGNPPFRGFQYQTDEQKEDMENVFPKKGKFGKLDFVATWFYKTAIFSKSYPIESAFVSTNSVCQGESAGLLWTPLSAMGVHINFAHRTFQWENDAKGKAAVHCVIVGFSHENRSNKIIFDYPDIRGKGVAKNVTYINPYLVDADTGAIPSRSKPIDDRNKMTQGSKPVDGGFLILNAEERRSLLDGYPELEKWIKSFVGSRELINNIERYCLWLAESSARERKSLLGITEIKRRIEGVKAKRLSSPTASFREAANTPYLFTENRQPEGNFLAVPEVSSQRRKYIPITYLGGEHVPSNKIYTIPNTELFDFGILISEMHMDWMRTVCGRLKSDYSYSPNIYHLFPFPDADNKQKMKVEQCAQGVLDERKKEPESSLSDLYDPDIMPEGLLKAHKALDKAVEKCYQKTKFKNEMDRLSFLFTLYKSLSENKI